MLRLRRQDVAMTSREKKRSCCDVMVSKVMGQCQQWDLHCSVYFYKRAHEYPVLDRSPGSNDLELDLRWVCAVSCARKLRSKLSLRSTEHSTMQNVNWLKLNIFFTIFDVYVIYYHFWPLRLNCLVLTKSSILTLYFQI